MRVSSFAAIALTICLGGPGSARAEEAPFDPGAGVLDTPSLHVAVPTRVLLDAAAVAGKRVVAAGEHGVVILSDDDGATWRQVVFPVNVTVTSLVFVSPQIGYATGHFGTILRTDDAGEHWKLLLDGRAVPALMLAAAGTDAHAIKIANLTRDDGPDKPFLVAQPASADHVRVFGSSGIAVETADGGKSWTDFSRHIENPAALNLYGGVVGANGSVVVAGEQGLLAAGNPDDMLHKLASPYVGSFFGLLGLPDGKLLTYGLLGHAFLSSDQGATWTNIANTQTTTFASAVRRDDGTVLLGDSQGGISELVQAQNAPPSLAPTALRAPWPVVALIETQAHSLLAFGPGGVLRLPDAPGSSRRTP